MCVNCPPSRSRPMSLPSQILNARVTEAFDELKAAFAAPVGLTDERSVASTEDSGEHIAIGEQAAQWRRSSPSLSSSVRCARRQHRLARPPDAVPRANRSHRS